MIAQQTVHFQFTCPLANNVHIKSQGTQFVWQGPGILGYSAWRSTLQNGSIILGPADSMELVYMWNPGFFHPVCYYSSNVSTPNIIPNHGRVVYSYGEGHIAKDACKRTTSLSVECTA